MIGTKLAHYEITAHLGSGGMGDVYQATDLKLKRSVAIKLLPAEFSSDAERLSRFRREAQLLASLNHPNIAHIYGLEESGDKRCIVMELVEGETLQARLKRGPIPVDEALAIAKQICEALEAAHEKGVIHRDLKPGNVMLTADGKVKVLDFGLAKAFEQETSVENLSSSPTLMSGASVPGVILGTASYMSPEQARGRKVDRRTDIFAFGCVLYEMLTGKRAFDGEDITEILGRVVTAEPDWTRFPVDGPRDVQKLLRLCLQKNANNRRSSATDVRIDLEHALIEKDNVSLVPGAAQTGSQWPWIATAIVALLTAAAVSILYLHSPPKDAAVVRFTIPPPKKIFYSGAAVPEIALSPDGKTLAFIAMDGVVPRLWVRAIDAVDPRLMPGTDGASMPFWSPDSKFIAFYAGGRIAKIALDGGSPQPICDVPGNPMNVLGAWNQDGVIVFGVGVVSNSGAGPGGLYRTSAAGGPALPLTSLKDKEIQHTFPQFLPDGRHFLYSVRTAQPNADGLYAGSLDSSESKRIFGGSDRTVYSAGHLLFVRDGKLMAQPFDPVRLETHGDPFLVADAVGANGRFASLSASDAGVLAYGGAAAAGVQLTWFDRAGRPLGALGSPDRYVELRVSPDGKRVALERNDVTLMSSDLWLAELSSGIFSRFTTDPANEADPVWSPDSRQIAFWSNRKGQDDLYIKTIGGSDETVLLDAPGNKVTDDWSKDGRFVIFRNNVEAVSTAYALPMFGDDRRPIFLLKDPFPKDEFNVSPDGHWIAYNSGQSEKTQVYVGTFPSMKDRRQVSNDGGGEPKWRRDGKELYYLSEDGKMMAVDIKSAGETIETGAPKILFQTPIDVNLTLDQYDVTADGQKFLLLQPAEQTTVPPITVVINWLSAVHRN